MSLIPIIYISLILFFVLTIVVLFASFISYKLKSSGNNSENYTENNSTLCFSPQIVSQQPVYFHKPAEIVPQKTNFHHSTIDVDFHEQLESPGRNYFQTYTHSNENKITKTSNSRDRFTIMNSTQETHFLNNKNSADWNNTDYFKYYSKDDRVLFPQTVFERHSY